MYAALVCLLLQTPSLTPTLAQQQTDTVAVLKGSIHRLALLENGRVTPAATHDDFVFEDVADRVEHTIIDNVITSLHDLREARRGDSGKSLRDLPRIKQRLTDGIASARAALAELPETQTREEMFAVQQILDALKKVERLTR